MKKHKSILYNLIIAGTLIFSASCTEDFEAAAIIKNPADSLGCDTAICTYDYRSIVIHLTNKRNPERALQLESHRVYFTKSGIDLTEKLTNKMLFSDASRYEIASDGIIDELAFSGTSITFEAKINKFKTWRHEFMIGRDCCHVYAAEGQKMEFEL